MKRLVYVDKEVDNKSLTVDDIPDIDNRIVTLEQLLDWIDKVVEVGKHEQNICN